MKGKTLIEYFYHQEKARKDLPFLHQPFGEKWETYTWGEAGQMARKMANYLLSQKLPAQSNIGLVSKNCREWVIADLAIMMAGHISVPFFANLTGEQISEVLSIGDVKLLFAGKVEVWDDMGKGVPESIPIVRFPHYEGNSKISEGTGWNEIMNSTEPLETGHIPKMADLWTIIFTSGTTGTPKGVMHDFANVHSLIESAFAVKNPLNLSESGENKFFSFLPLNHIAERAVVEIMCLRYGGEISFTESIDRFAANLQDVKPNLFFAVPRIWQKFRSAILVKLPEKKLNTLLKIPIIKGIIKKKIVTGLGLQDCRCSAVGAAPIAQETKDWFKKIGIPITEGYGMTENCAATSFLYPHEDKPGSVGLPHDGAEVKIDPKNNEILTKSGYIMTGYYKDPEKTAETIVDGWLHTGDQGRMDEDGYVYITGRVKDTFKTEKGEFIVPAQVESKFESCVQIEQMCLLGLGMPQPIMLVSLTEEAAKESKEDIETILKDQLILANKSLSGYNRVCNVVVIKEPFSIENNMMTPTLKVKRSQVHDKFKSRLLNWCKTEAKVIWE